MNLKANSVTINTGVARKAFGVLVVVVGIIAAAAGGHGAVPENWRLAGCLAVSLAGAAMISPTDRLKLDFVDRRYLRVYGWAPFLQFRGGTFDDLEGISIHQASRGAGEGGGHVSRVLFLNWTHDLRPFELASFDESRKYSGSVEPLVVLTKPNPADLVTGVEAANLMAEAFRARLGFHLVGAPQPMPLSPQ